MRRKDREVTDNTAILDIIEKADSCVLGMVDTTGPVPIPYLVALNHGFEPAANGMAEGGTFWFHCAREGRKLDLIRQNNQVCVQLDCDHEPVTGPVGCSWGMKFASIVAQGTARIVEDPLERRQGLDCLMRHYMRLWADHMPSGMPGAMAAGSSPIPYEEKYLAMTVLVRVDVTELSAKRKA